MAWAKGTCTDWIDYMRKIRDYSAGLINPATDPEITSGTTVPSGDQWTILSNGSLMPALPGSGFATDGEFYLQGKGSDPADQIIVGCQSYRNVGNNIFGFRTRGFTAFNNTLAFTTLPGVSPLSVHTAVDDNTFQTWFWTNSRRIMTLARVGTIDILTYMGFILQFGTRGQYPYPLFVAGSSQTSTQNFQLNDFTQSSLPDPCPAGSYLRWVDGSWLTCQHYSSGGGGSRGQARDSSLNTLKIWPQRNPTTNEGSDNTTTYNENTFYQSYSSGQQELSSSEIGLYQMFPAILMTGTQLIGVIDGLYIVPGLGLNSGDTLTDPNTGQVYDVFKNTWRSEWVDYFAIKRA